MQQTSAKVFPDIATGNAAEEKNTEAISRVGIRIQRNYERKKHFYGYFRKAKKEKVLQK